MESETDDRQVLAARWPQLTPLVEALTAAESVRRLRDPMALHKLLTIATDVPYNPGGAGCARLTRRAAAVPHPQQRTRGVAPHAADTRRANGLQRSHATMPHGTGPTRPGAVQVPATDPRPCGAHPREERREADARGRAHRVREAAEARAPQCACACGLGCMARRCKSRRGKLRQGKARQGKARQGKARQGKAVWHAAGVLCARCPHACGLVAIGVWRTVRCAPRAASSVSL